MLIMEDIITWVKDGPYRRKVLNKLGNENYLSSELADSLNINRASMSRILRQMKNKDLVDGTKAGSRTKSYSLTDKGKKVLENIR